MTAAPTGELMLISVKRYEQLTHQNVTPEDCCSSISCQAFKAAFSRYLLWELDSASQCPLRQLDKKIQSN